MQNSRIKASKNSTVALVRSCLVVLFLLAGAGLSLMPQGYDVYASYNGDRPVNGTALNDGELQTPPPMQISAAERVQLARMHNKAPVLALNKSVPQGLTSRTLGGSLNLLTDRGYVFPSNRTQQSCGDCWVWAGTGVLEQALYTQMGISDTLSVQYFSSTYSNGSGNRACCGGWVWDFTDHYSSSLHKAIPWSNTNANFVDGSRSCGAGTARAPGGISTTPNYPISSISYATIPNSNSADEAAAITSIKSVLDSGNAIFFDFYVTNVSGNNDWALFTSFWNNQPESAIYSGGFSCGKSATNWAGHAVVCVGYSDGNIDPNNDCWIMMNSWGTRSNRPNGLFRIPMHYNYSCSSSGVGYNTEWWSIPVTFGPFTIPAAPDLSSPANGATVSGPSVTLQWNAPSGADRYVLDICDSPGFASLFYRGVLGNVTSQTVNGFPNNGTTYYWRVLAGNGAGYCSWADASAKARYFNNGTATIPSAPDLSSPSNGATVSGTSVNFQWNAPSGADRYVLDICDSPGFASLFYRGVLGNVTSQTVTGFPNNGTTYYWRVLAGNSAGYCSWAAANAKARYFNNGTAAIPSAPDLSSPSNGAAVSGTSVNFQWNAPSGADRYVLDICDSPGFANLFYRRVLGNVTSQTVTGFPNNGTTYYWRVLAGNSAGYCSWAAANAKARYFNNGTATIPSAPDLSSPNSGATVSGTSVSFQWNAPSGADRYVLDICDSPGFAVLFYRGVLGNVTSQTVTGFPNNGTTYYWRVLAGNNAGYNSWADANAKARYFLNGL